MLECDSVGQPVIRTYLHQLCGDTRCCLEDLPRMMDNRDGWLESVRELYAVSTT